MKREIETEILVAREAKALMQRRPHYSTMVAGLYLLSLFGLERGRIMRSSYFPVRFVDDLLDGDAQGVSDPTVYARELSQRIANNSLTDEPIDRQLRYAIDTLESKARANDDPRGDFVRAIEAIIFDNERAGERRMLSLEEIEQYYRRAFDPVINITLQAIDSSFRANDLPALSYGQGRVYSVRDFQTDWKRGIINVPRETLVSAGLTQDSSFEGVSGNQVITSWLYQSLTQTKPDLLETRELIQRSGEKQTQAVGISLIVPMLKFIEAH